jgi:hypothetical protein
MENKKSCLINTTLYDACPASCKTVTRSSEMGRDIISSCIAREKLNAFLEGETTFTVGITAFYQANAEILNSFILEKLENKELISYYLSISDPEKVSDIIENLSDSIVYDLFRTNYKEFTLIRENYSVRNRGKNFFEIKGNRYWSGVSFQKICNLIQYSIREKQEYQLVSQFLVILPPGVVTNLKEFTHLTAEEEKNLYLALGDAIYEVPIIAPDIYHHMMSVLADEFEIALVLGTMEELVKRQKKILDITAKLIEYYEENSYGLNIQNIYSELNGLEPEMITEILNQLREKKVLSDSQRDMLNMVFQRGSIDFLKALKDDILR